MTIVNVEQRSAAWFAERCGRVTGSVAAAMLSNGKGGAESAGRKNLRARLVAERLTGITQDENGYESEPMRRGTELEPLAFAAYEVTVGMVAMPIGFLRHDTLMAGASPDGVVGDGILELKCPNTATHIEYLRGDGLPSKYKAQVTHNLWVSGAAFCDFVSFDDRLPAALQVFHWRVQAKDLDLSLYEQQVRAFLDEVDREVEALQTMADLRGQLQKVLT